MIEVLMGRDHLQGDRQRSRWIGETPPPVYLAPSEPRLDDARFFTRDRHGELRLVPSKFAVGVVLTIIARPVWDMVNGTFLDDGWLDYALEIIAVTCATLYGVVWEYRKHSK